MQKFLVFLGILTFTLTASAQEENPLTLTDEEVCEQPQVLDAYVDSLRLYRHQLDSVMAVNDSLLSIVDRSADGRYARVFSPLRFYPELARRRFSLDADNAMLADDQYVIDNALLNSYLYNPQYVSLLPQAKSKDGKKDKDAKQESEKPAVQMTVSKAEEATLQPVELVVVKPNFWNISGENYLQIMQNYYSGNWYQGGESNYSALGRVTIQANYNNKQKVKFENKLEMNLGFQTNRSDTVHSVKASSDLLRYTGKLGLQASKKWYYTLQLVASSQFAKSFATNSHSFNSAFLSPATVNVSVGMDYNMSWLKNKLTGTIHLAPIAANYKYVSRAEIVTKHGIEEGKHSVTDYGSTFTIDAAWKISDNVSWKSRLYGYTTYKRVELQWENNFNLKISKYIAANIYLYPRFDDSQAHDEEFGYFQMKEYTSLGLTYSF